MEGRGPKIAVSSDHAPGIRSGGEPAVHRDRGAGDVTTAFAGQVHDGPGDVVGQAIAAERRYPAQRAGRRWSAGFMSVSMRPPCTTVAVIPRGPRSRARPRVRPVSADLAMEYRVMPGSGTLSASALPTVMMRPPSGMCRAAAWAATNTARTSTAHSRSA